MIKCLKKLLHSLFISNEQYQDFLRTLSTLKALEQENIGLKETITQLRQEINTVNRDYLYLHKQKEGLEKELRTESLYHLQTKEIIHDIRGILERYD